MLREHMINFREATVGFLLLTNALSISVAAWAICFASYGKGAPTMMYSRLKRFFAAKTERAAIHRASHPAEMRRS